MKTDLEKIIAVSGKGGLFRIITGGKATIIVEGLADGKKQPIHTTQKVSTLSDISIFGNAEDVPLRTILANMTEHYADKETPDPKGVATDLRKEMKKVFPDYDESRVYESDIRKLFTWFQILKSRDMLEFDELPDKEEKEPDSPDRE